MGKIYGRSASNFAAEAVKLALDDAGLQKEQVDGLLINANLSSEMGPMLQMTLGFEDLSLLNVMNAYGSTAGTMIQYAAMAIQEGLANVVVLVYADAPLAPTRSSGASYSGAGALPLTGMDGLRYAYGYYGANPGYAMASMCWAWGRVPQATTSVPIANLVSILEPGGLERRHCRWQASN